MSDEKRIIIDEDWKSRVEAEKEEAVKGAQPTAAQGPPAGPADLADVELPPASLEMLLTTLGTEALMAMGQLPHPVTGQRHPVPNQARYLIDTIEVLRDKTKGNLTSDEQQLIDNLLHQLRMVFVEAMHQPPMNEPSPPIDHLA
jgi:hypothetical protein